MNEVSVESVDRLLAFSDKLRDIQNKFVYGAGKVRSDINIIVSNASLKLDEVTQLCVDAKHEVDRCREELGRIKDEMEYLRSVREDYDSDDYRYEMNALRDDYDNAKSDLSYAREEYENCKDKKSEALRLYNDIRFWCSKIESLSTGMVECEFQNCRSFVEKYGNYLVDVLKNV